MRTGRNPGAILPPAPVVARVLRTTGVLAGLLLLPHCSEPDDDSGFATPTAVPTLAPGQTPTATPGAPVDTHLHLLSAANVTIEGGSSGDHLGAATVIVGDLNGDGIDDLAASAPGEDSAQPDAGLVGILFGQTTDLPSGTLNFPASYTGEGRGDAAGQALARGGDLNGDGYADLLIGAPNQDTGGTDSGRVYAILGHASGWYPKMRISDADFSILGEPGERIGQGGSLAGGGDLNGDGYDDIVIGSPFYSRSEASADTEAGRVYIIPGQASGWSNELLVQDLTFTLEGTGTREWAGFSVAIVPDLNGDGYDELLIGAPHGTVDATHQGVVYLWMGRASFPTGRVDLSTAERRFVGESEGEEAGAWVERAGDQDQDGLTDLLVGAWGTSSLGARGRFYVVYTEAGLRPGMTPEDVLLRRADVIISGSAAYEYLGRPGLGVGDLNQDGLDDLLLGSSLINQALLFVGREDGLPSRLASGDADQVFLGVQSSDATGSAIGGLGDLNADGYMDFLIGAINADNRSNSDGGAVYIEYGNAELVARPKEGGL